MHQVWPTSFLIHGRREEIFGRCWPHLLLYKRFIDDIRIVWKGSRDELDQFFNHVGANQYGIKFTANVDRNTINFLDLEVFKNINKLSTRTHFKDTDRNGYIPIRSCHHPQWKKAIPKGQFIRIRHNCDLMGDYYTQTNILIESFVAKGYNRYELEHTRDKVRNMDREIILQNKTREQNQKDKVPFITGFNKQYKVLERIVKKNWPIISNDPHLNKILPSKPTFIYRRAKGSETKRMFLTPQRKCPLSLTTKVFFRCGKCKPCRLIRKREK